MSTRGNSRGRVGWRRTKLTISSTGSRTRCWSGCTDQTPREPLSGHVVGAMRQALAGLAADPAFAELIDAPAITLNDVPAMGPRAALERLVAAPDGLACLDASSVRIHGDFFLENILWRPHAADGRGPQLVLIDPVSVAGVDCALPLFDLVKYESYATGELWALRSELVEVGGIGEGSGAYRHRIRWEDSALQPFRARNWHGVFRARYEQKHGRVDPRAYRLIDGYFSLAMALNTFGKQRQARLLKATAELNAVIG
jgi:hypothetical protein